jgi:hypothetical protein
VGLARAHNALGEVARLTDDIATAEREYRRSLSIHHAIGSTGTLVTRLNLAMVLLAHGDATAAERLLSPLISELSRVDERGHLCAAHCQLLPCRAAADDWEAWDRDVAEAEGLLEEPPSRTATSRGRWNSPGARRRTPARRRARSACWAWRRTSRGDRAGG